MEDYTKLFNMMLSRKVWWHDYIYDLSLVTTVNYKKQVLDEKMKYIYVH